MYQQHIRMTHSYIAGDFAGAFDRQADSLGAPIRRDA